MRITLKMAVLPSTIPAMTGITADGYLMVINQIMSQEVKQRAFRHELAHIRKHHFTDSRQLEELECEADYIADNG